MKKPIILFGLLTVMLLALFAQTAAKPRLAVVEFSTNVNTEKAKADAIAIRNLAESHLVGTGKYEIITREEIDKLLANQSIQVSRISSAENIQKLQLQNISYIVTGSVDAIGNDYAVTVKVLDVSSGEFSHSVDDIMGSGSRELYAGITALMNKFVAGLSSEGGRIGQTGQGQKSYEIGDRGPGGGFIFHTEGGVYMEVSLPLGSYNWNDAIEVARNYKGGGFSDWRLPTQDELNTIYVNLRKRNLAGLGNDTYWSSSQYGNNYAIKQRFSDGYQYDYSKSSSGSVRAIRVF